MNRFPPPRPRNGLILLALRLYAFLQLRYSGFQSGILAFQFRLVLFNPGIQFRQLDVKSSNATVMVARVFPNFLSVIFHARFKAFGIPTHHIWKPLSLREFAR
jgi:hypothetical protein